MVIELGKINQITDKYQNDPSMLIQILLEIQYDNRWLPKEALARVSEQLGVPLNQIYQVATFYKAFSLVPKGRHIVTMCMGTACHVRGSPRILDRVQGALGIEPGETTSDLNFSLETTNCLGCCALGPVMVVDGEYHGHLSPAEVKHILEKCE